MGRAQRDCPAETAAGRDVEVIENGGAGRYRLIIVRCGNGEGGSDVRVGVGHARGRAEGYDVTRRGGGMAVEVAGRIVISVAVHGRTAVLHYAPAEIQIPINVVARARHAIRPSAAVVGRAELSSQAFAPDHVAGRIFVLHVGGTEIAKIRLAGGINAVVRRRIIQLDRDREIESVNQADVVVVATS